MELDRNERAVLAARLLIAWRQAEESVADVLLDHARAQGINCLTVQELLEVARNHMLANERGDLLPPRLAEYLRSAPMAELRDLARSRFPRDRYTSADFPHLPPEPREE